MELTDREISLGISKAMEARERAYVPYSHYPVGAALLCEDGNWFTGCNMENISFGATLCAERNAIGSAVAFGNRKMKAIFVVGSLSEMTLPCGICLQVIAEFRIPTVVCATSPAHYKVFSLQELLPHAFFDQVLKK